MLNPWKNKKIPLIIRVESYLQFSNQKMEHVFALSEFIDNSIASYKTIHENTDGLKIKFIIDNRDDANQKLIIIDNAAGMNEEELGDGIQSYKKVDESGSNLNQFGIGMKQASFWLGKDLEIFTKSIKTEKVLNLELKLSNKSPQDELESVEINQVKEEGFIEWKSGTKIIVSNIWNEGIGKKTRAIVFASNKYDSLKNKISDRYEFFIKEGMEIIFEDKTNDKKQKNKDIVKINELNPFNVEIDLKEIIKKSQKKYSVDDIVIKLEEIYNKNPNPLFSEAIEKIRHNEDLVFEREIFFEKESKIIKFYLFNRTPNKNKSGMKYYCGLMRYHCGRAINPKIDFAKKDDIKNKYKDGGAKLDPINRWFRGEIDLTNILSLDSNKQDFNDPDEINEILQKQLYKIYSELEPMIRCLIKIRDSSKNEIMNNEDEKNLRNYAEEILTEDKSFITDGKYNQIDPDNFKFDFNLWGIKFSIIESQEENKLFIEYDPEKNIDNSYIIKIYRRHQFWQPIFKTSNNEFRQMIYRMTIIMLVLDKKNILFENKDFNDINLYKIIKKICKDMNN